MKVAPSKTVNSSDNILTLKSPSSIAWWVQVTEIPEDTSKIVFKKGIPLGSKGEIPTGGQTPPSSTAGDSARCR